MDTARRETVAGLPVRWIGKGEKKRSERVRTKRIEDDGPWSDTWNPGAFQKIMLRRSRQE